MENLSINASGDASFNLDLKKLVAQDGTGTISDSLGSGALNELAKLGKEQARAVSDILSSHRANFHISPDGTITITAERVDTFMYFPKLPPEVRMKIWAQACDKSRIVDVQISKVNGRDWREYCFKSGTPVPAALHTSCESRRECLKYFTATLHNTRRPLIKTQPPIYINFEKDTVYFAPSADFPETEQRKPNFLGLGISQLMYRNPQHWRRLRMVAVPVIKNAGCMIPVVLLDCTALEKVILVGPEAEKSSKDNTSDSFSQSYSREATLQYPTAANRVQRENEVAEMAGWFIQDPMMILKGLLLFLKWLHEIWSDLEE